MTKVRSLSNNKKRKVAILLDQAKQAMARGAFDVCEGACRQIDAMQAGNSDVANLRGIMAVQSEEYEKAEELFVQAINATPRRPEFHDNLGKLYLRHKLYADAMERYRTALHYNPNSLDVKLGYCASLTGIGSGGEALPMLERLRGRDPHHPDVLMCLFHALYQLKRFDEALGCLDAMIDRDASHFEARFSRAKVFREQGRLLEAETELRAALALRPEHAEAYAIVADLKKFTADDDPDKKAIEALYEKSGPDSHERVLLCFALAKAHEDLGKFDKAFGFYEEGNALRHSQSSYDPDAELAHLQAVVTIYTPEVLRRTSDLQDERPIFIVGMPRCGSTLTEQILASHPEVSSRGEWAAFERVLHDCQHPGQLLTLEEMIAFSPAQWRDAGQAYLDRLDEGPRSNRVTDKTLENFRLVGAIHCALPRARIVHVRRHPLDNCLSIYRAYLQGKQFDFAYSMGEIGYYYRMYQRVMQRWREVLPAGVMYELDYEQLATNQEAETRKLLAFCGLPWDERCMAFNKAKNVVQTSSVAQVRRGMYTDGLARWKNYEKHLQPLLRILDAR